MEATQVLEKGNSGSGKRPKADWSNEKNTEIFLTVCIEQVRAGNRPHAHFNKVGWANVINKFNEQTCLSYEYKQMKNKWDILKKEWQLWKKLKGKETGIGWDYVSRTVTASDEWWKAKIQVNFISNLSYIFICLMFKIVSKLFYLRNIPKLQSSKTRD